MEEGDVAYIKAKQEALDFMKNNRKITGGCLNDVRVENEAFNHLIWKRKNHKRPIYNSYVRLKCFVFIDKILKNLNLYQEYKCEMENVRVKRRGKYINTKVQVEYFGFIGILFSKGLRVKVVVKKVDGWNHGELVSVIPAWETIGYKDYKFKETFFEEEE